jgi:hypothetical protein
MVIRKIQRRRDYACARDVWKIGQLFPSEQNEQSWQQSKGSATVECWPVYEPGSLLLLKQQPSNQQARDDGKHLNCMSPGKVLRPAMERNYCERSDTADAIKSGNIAAAQVGE